MRSRRRYKEALGFGKEETQAIVLGAIYLFWGKAKKGLREEGDDQWEIHNGGGNGGDSSLIPP